MAEVVKGIAVGLAVVLQVDLIEEVVIQKVNGLRDKSLYIFIGDVIAVQFDAYFGKQTFNHFHIVVLFGEIFIFDFGKKKRCFSRCIFIVDPVGHRTQGKESASFRYVFFCGRHRAEK